MNHRFADRTLSDLALSLPGSVALLHDHRLDFGCGGQRSLREAASEHDLDLQRLISAFDALPADAPAPDWQGAGSAPLIDHILARYHQVHRQQLPALIAQAQRTERAHATHPQCPGGLAEHLTTMQQELEWHMCKEEGVLFPWLRQGIPLTHVQGPIGVMRHEHDEHAQSLLVLAELTDAFTAPADADEDWRQLYAGLETLRRDLVEHIHLENNLLFVGAQQPG
ncbi:iron-sulfur cluster repair protein YtfE [Pseudomonas sp. PDNC002]|uniref:iron-sulfur cluster repair protein YtfE n=1 Tax=Pseudomonas sp. PDNC002 TaxID=2811422 RepID=UPI001966A3B7|nr:iron-sulfur cluster repair protein YtfE [Pseudomonas sp. PDNC002]QRY80433.1 iron-sulfur cluster repair protein YtfE [Pseudomonas sp. PDNC002]